MSTKPNGHTPGPWSARLNDWSRWDILYANGILASVAKHDDPASPPPVSETTANAALIASAPDLLAENERLREALTDLLRMVEGSLNDDVGPNSIDVGDPCEAEELCGSPRCEYGCVTLKIRNARAALQSR